MKKNQKELNSIIIRDNNGRKTIKKIARSSLILKALIILLQILFIVFFVLKLQQYIEYYFLTSIVISVGFMIYLVNKQDRNEFKISWFISIMIFPLVGVTFYYLYLTDTGKIIAKKAFNRSLEQTKALESSFENKNKSYNYPQVRDLQTYLGKERFFSYENNKIDYFPCGELFYEDFIKSLKNANEFIFLETFILDVDETWAEILKILESKAGEGVEVRVMYDAFGSQLASGSTYVKYLQSKNIKTCVFNPMIPIFTTKQNSRDHRKIYIIDGKICYSGGLNLANEYFNYGKNRFSYWKDNAIKIQGEAVKSFTTMFLQNWNMQIKSKVPDNYERYLNIPYESFENEGLTIPYGDNPYCKEYVASNVYTYIINSSKKYLHITSPYILLDDNFQETLLFAAKRGVEVKLIVPSVPDHFVTFCIGKTFLKTLIENGVKVYLYKKGFIHAKTFISDDVIATVGSINLDYRSLYYHFECGTVLYEVPVIAEIEKDFQNTLIDCEEMKSEDYKKLPWIERAVGRVFRIFAPLM